MCDCKYDNKKYNKKVFEISFTPVKLGLGSDYAKTIV